MIEKLNLEAMRFLQELAPRVEPPIHGELRELLSVDEIDAIDKVLAKRTYKEILAVVRPGLSPLARLQLLIGLQYGTLTEQVRRGVKWEMSDRNMVHKDDNLNQVEWARATEVSPPQVHRFLHGSIDGVVKSSTLDRISRPVEMLLNCDGWLGTVYSALRPLEPTRPEIEGGIIRGGSITCQLRQALKREMDSGGWTQADVARLTGISQSQVCRFLQGRDLETTALDQIGALLWVNIDCGPEIMAKRGQAKLQPGE